MEAAPKEAAVQSAAALTASDVFEELLQKEFVPGRQQQVAGLVRDVLGHAVENVEVIGDSARETLQRMQADLDELISAQLNEILHHEELQKLEGSWRGLHHLVSKTETSPQLQVRVLPVSKEELRFTFKDYANVAWDQSPIFKLVYGELDTPGAWPFGAMVCDYEFGYGPMDVQILEGLARIGAAAHCPFIAGAGPELMDMKSWQEINTPPDIAQIFDRQEYAEWRSLRESDDSRYLGLVLPKFLSRLPYGSKTDQVRGFNFEEVVDGETHDKYTWSNAAYAMGANITQAFARFGWCACIRGKGNGGIVEDLPLHTFGTDGFKCPTEISIGDRREHELARAGLMPLQHWKNTDYAVFASAQSVQKPQGYYDQDANASAVLSAQLPHVFAASRFAHYLKCMVRERIGKYDSKDRLQRDLNEWLANYVVEDPESVGPETLASKPLRHGEAFVEDIPGQPGAYNATFLLSPHYQLDSMSISLRLVARLQEKK